MPTKHNPGWGLLSDHIISLACKRYWSNRSVLKSLLTGEKSFPLHLPLKPPTGNQALTDLAHLQNFVDNWKAYAHPELVQWKEYSFRHLGRQEIPTRLTLNNFKQLAEFLGSDTVAQCESWQHKMRPVLNLNAEQSLYPALVKHLESLENLSNHDATLLAKALPQLKPGLGNGEYLRALPLLGIDTKFLESNMALVEALLDTQYSGAVTAMGGIYSWLNCRRIPNGLAQGVPLVRPLCKAVRQKIGGLPLFQLPSDILRDHSLPANNILVVENLQPGLGLPELEDTIAVIGGGRNIAWMDAPWLQQKRVAYWGDIDTWGLHILSDARKKISKVQSLMMDLTTLKTHEERMVPEPEPVEANPTCLTEPENQMFYGLKDGRFLSSRLEQERISADYIQHALETWLVSD